MKSMPLISCILPTLRRRAFLEQSIKMFQAQDYPNKELVIFEDEDEDNGDIACGPHIYYHSIAGTHTIGEMRNRACTMARGDIFCLWEDDDRYGPQRLSQQVAPLLSGEGDVSAMHMSLLYHLPTKTYWHVSDEEHARLFTHDVRSGTLMYWSSYFHTGLLFEKKSRGEDAAYLQSLLNAGARLARVTDPASYVCVRHGGNVTDEMEYENNPHWQRVVEEGKHDATSKETL